MLPAHLTDEELDAICRPYKQHAARVRYLRSLGLAVRPRPDGSPLVARSHFEQVMGSEAKQAANGPTWVIRDAAEKYIADQWPLFNRGDA